MLDDSLLGPSTRGQFMGASGQSVPYELRLLSDACVERLATERDAYLATQGVSERGPATDTMFDDELALRMCATCVRHPDNKEPLLPLSVWRRLDRALIALVSQHYAELEASDRPSANQLDELFVQVSELVRAKRSGVARELEDYRMLFARQLFHFYGRPAAELTLAQVLYHALYTSELMPRDG